MHCRELIIASETASVANVIGRLRHAGELSTRSCTLVRAPWVLYEVWSLQVNVDAAP